MFFIEHSEALNNRAVIVEIKGPLNSQTSEDFEEYINRLLEKGKNFIILNAGGIESVSSEGIGLMLYIQKKISSNNGFFTIYGINSEISTLYGLLGITKIISIVKSRDDALEIVNKHLQLRESDEMPVDHAPPREEEKIEFVPIEEPEPEIVEDKSSVSLSSDEDIDFKSPVIAECTDCKSLIRIKKSGTYLCPDCHREFTVEKDQSVIF